MKIVGNYSDDVRNLITGSDAYVIPVDIVPYYTQEDYNLALTESPLTINENFSNGFPKVVNQQGGGAGAPTFMPDESAIGTDTPIEYSDYQERPIVKLNVLNSVSALRGSFELEFNRDFYIKNKEKKEK